MNGFAKELDSLSKDILGTVSPKVGKYVALRLVFWYILYCFILDTTMSFTCLLSVASVSIFLSQKRLLWK